MIISNGHCGWFFGIMFHSFITYTGDNIKLQIGVNDDIVTYHVPIDIGSCFFSKGNSKIKEAFSFVVQQCCSLSGIPRPSLSVIWAPFGGRLKYMVFQGAITSCLGSIKKDTDDGLSFIMKSHHKALEWYKDIIKMNNPSFVTEENNINVFEYDIKCLDENAKEMQLMRAIFYEYAKNRGLRLKYKDEILYEPPQSYESLQRLLYPIKNKYTWLAFIGGCIVAFVLKPKIINYFSKLLK